LYHPTLHIYHICKYDVKRQKKAKRERRKERGEKREAKRERRKERGENRRKRFSKN
jgi:hypothetical protein